MYVKLVCRVLVLWLAGMVSFAYAVTPEVEQMYYDKNTIRTADVPPDAPTFTQYAVHEKFSGKPAAPDVKSHSRSRLFRTMIRLGAKQGPNFAGHYTLVFWGCGTSCRQLAIVNAKNGKVFHPSNLGMTGGSSIAYEEFEELNGDDELVRFRRDSKLLMVIGDINEDESQRGISWFVWDREQLKRIRFVHKPSE